MLSSLIVAFILLAPPNPEPHAADAPIQLLDVSPADTLPGAVRPRQQATLGSAFDAMLTEVRVKEGARVRAGDILAVLDDRVAQASVELARFQANRTALVERAEAALEQARDDLARLNLANRSHAVAPNELASAETDLHIARADLDNAREAIAQAQLQLALAQAQLEEHVIRAPFDALVVRRRAEPGEVLSASDPILDLIADSAMSVDLHLPARVAARLQAGERFALRVEDPEPSVVPARVRFIEPRIDPISRTMRVVFDFEPAPTVVSGSIVRPAESLPPEPITAATLTDADARPIASAPR